jgi:capsid protein
MSVINSIKAFISRGGRYFHEESELLKYINKTNNDFELSKATSAEKANREAIAMNANSDIISAVRLSFERGVIGKGISIQSRTGNKEFDKEFEKQIRIWSKRGNCEITGRFHRGLSERSLVGYAKVQGGFILKHHMNKKWNIPYKFEILPLSMIDRTQDNIYDNIINGIKINNDGEIKGIYLYEDQERNISRLVNYKDLTLYVIPFLDPTQYSGVTPIAPVLATLDLLSEYSKSELDSAKDKAKGSIVVKSSLFEQIMKIKQEKAKRTGNGKLSEAEVFDLYKHFQINGGLSGANYIPNEDDVINIHKGAETIYEQLDLSTKRTVSAGLGLSTQTTIREMPSSYNSALLNSQQDDLQFEIEFDNFVELAWRDVVENRLLTALILSNKLSAPNFWTNPEEYKMVEFMRKTVSHIDPTKAEAGISEGLTNGTLNKIDELSKKGVDFETNIDKEIQYELLRKQKYEEAGLDYPQAPQNDEKDQSNDEKSQKSNKKDDEDEKDS